MSRSYKKLVRDLIPEKIIATGKSPVTHILSDKEYQHELFRKLEEEVSEVIDAKNKEQQIEELADVQEVLLALYKSLDIQCEEVTGAGRKKRKQNGSFEKKIFLEDVK
jgi:predicted house-cleaning noncanonical NTP pyrophosphatase (MazG superfamily)